ncbi:MAG: MFS transporter [Anaerovoracaceae bacterium]
MNEQLIKKSRRHAWFVVVAGFATFFMVFGAAINCPGMFMVPMSESLGVDRAVISSLFTIQMLVAIPSGIVFGRITDKTDLKWPMAVCCFLVGLGFIAYGTISNIYILYGAAVLIGIGVAGTVQIPVSVFINGWFIEKKGTAMGLTMVGSGVGGSVLTQIVSRIIESSGWQNAYIFLGAATMIITIPLVILFITKDPHRKGLIRYGEENLDKIMELQNNALAEDLPNRSISEIMKVPAFWYLFIGLTLLTLPMGAVKGHVVAYMTDLGYSPQIAANILTITILAVIPGKPLTGLFFDKFSARFAAIVCGFGMGVGYLLLLGIPYALFFAICFGVIYGFGSAFQSVGSPLCLKIVARTNTNFATILSILTIGSNAAAAFGTTILGAIRDNTGSYSIGFLIGGIVIIIGYIFVIVAVSAKKKGKEA